MGAGSVEVSVGTAASLSALWSDFTRDDRLRGMRMSDAAAAVGALVVRMTLPPGANGSATIALGWHFPHRTWMGGEVLGESFGVGVGGVGWGWVVGGVGRWRGQTLALALAPGLALT